jgi:c(7)-type cytochrome triheme protein
MRCSVARSTIAAWLLAVALLGGPWLVACSTSSSLLSLVFDGVPPPGVEQPRTPVVHPPRRPTYKPPELQPQIEIPDKPPPIDWQSRFLALARNAGGEVEWTRALNDKAIAPRPGIAADAKEDEPTDMDLEYVPKDQPQYKVVFPHKPHTQWLGCPNCHTGIFEMEKGKAVMTMDKLNAGAYCGVCHGKVALPELTNCPACHKSM